MSEFIDLLMQINWLKWITIAVSIYVIIESLNAICNMPQGYLMLCHKFKYVLALTTSLALIYYTFMHLSREFQWLVFGVSGTLFFFVWPRMLFRIKKILRELNEVLAL